MEQKIILYSTGCPKCSVLTKKLNYLGVEYAVSEDMDEMKALGLKAAPALSVDGVLMDFAESMRWVREQEMALRENG